MANRNESVRGRTGKHVLRGVAFAACWAAAAALAQVPAATPGVSASEAALRRTVDRHLAAINARDLDALLSTVTDGSALTTILPNGKVLHTREEYRRLHLDWFEDRDWRMLFALEQLRVLGDTGIARVRYDSQEKAADGLHASKRVAQLTLVFARERGDWRLVYDQNTVVPSANP